jgi:CheY-like chemotaxis protein
VALLVDDEPTVRGSTADMLMDLGFEVVEAESAVQALALAQDGQHFDLLLTDHLMPGMTGTELAREVQARWPGRPVLVISGFAEGEGVDEDLPRLTKPFRQAELAQMMAEITTP